MSPSKSGMNTFEWLTVLFTVIILLGGTVAWALGYFTPRTETQLLHDEIKEVRQGIRRVERRQMGEAVPVPVPKPE